MADEAHILSMLAVDRVDRATGRLPGQSICDPQPVEGGGGGGGELRTEKKADWLGGEDHA